MGTALWVVSGLLAFLFLGAGAMKLMKGRDKLLAEMGEQMGWVEDFSDPTVRFIGASEVLGAIGLIVPAATGILPILTPVAASALALVMVLAAGAHGKRGEMPAIGINLVLAAMLVFVAWGRFTATV